MKTSYALSWAGGTVALAAIFEISHNAVSQWGAEIPQSRGYELKVKKPEWFSKKGELRKPTKDELLALHGEAV